MKEQGGQITMKLLLELGALSEATFIGEVSATASGEFALEQLLDKIRASWSEMEFITIPNRDQLDVFIAYV